MSVSTSASIFTRSFRIGCPKSNIDGLVLWLHTASGGQRPGRNLAVLHHPCNVDDRQPVPGLSKKLFGKLFSDKGYISQSLAQTLRAIFDLLLITKLRKNMKSQRVTLLVRILLRRRAIMESIINQPRTSLSAIFSPDRDCSHDYSPVQYFMPVSFMLNTTVLIFALSQQLKKCVNNLRIKQYP